MQLATAPVVGEPSKPGQTALSGVERQAGGWVWMAIRLRTNTYGSPPLRLPCKEAFGSQEGAFRDASEVSKSLSLPPKPPIV